MVKKTLTIAIVYGLAFAVLSLTACETKQNKKKAGEQENITENLDAALKGTWQLIAVQNKDEAIQRVDSNGFLPSKSRTDLDGKELKRKSVLSFDDKNMTNTIYSPEVGYQSRFTDTYSVKTSEGKDGAKTTTIETTQIDKSSSEKKPLVIEIKRMTKDVLELAYINDLADRKPVAQYHRLNDLDLQKIAGSVSQTSQQQSLGLQLNEVKNEKSAKQGVELKHTANMNISCDLSDSQLYLRAQEKSLEAKKYVLFQFKLNSSSVPVAKTFQSATLPKPADSAEKAVTTGDFSIESVQIKNLAQEGALASSDISGSKCEASFNRSSQWLISGQIRCVPVGKADETDAKADHQEITGKFTCVAMKVQKLNSNE